MNAETNKFLILRNYFSRKRFREDCKAMAVAEFALVLPLMILLFVGTMEVSVAVSIDRKLSKITNVIGNLVAQSNTVVTLAEMEDMLALTQKLIKPYDLNPEIVVTGIDVLSNHKAKVRWACALLGPSPAIGSITDVPERISHESSFVVKTEVTLDYTPMIGWTDYVKKSGLSLDSVAVGMDETMYFNPRNNAVQAMEGQC